MRLEQATQTSTPEMRSVTPETAQQQLHLALRHLKQHGTLPATSLEPTIAHLAVIYNSQCQVLRSVHALNKENEARHIRDRCSFAPAAILGLGTMSYGAMIFLKNKHLDTIQLEKINTIARYKSWLKVIGGATVGAMLHNCLQDKQYNHKGTVPVVLGILILTILKISIWL